MVAPLSSWPWENLGGFKYLLYGPFLASILYSTLQEQDFKESWSFHVLLLSFLRITIHQLWTSFSNMHFLTQNRRILSQGVDFKQIDKEWDWDNYIILQALVASFGFYIFPFFGNLPLCNTKGFIAVLILHMAVSEPLYYLAHRLFHGRYLFTHYHSLHHSSPVPQPSTAGNATLLEHLILCSVVGAPILGACLLGIGSVAVIYGYILIFDFLRVMGHSNVEILPHQLFDRIPLLRYLLYTPTYHSLHHSEMETNFCLFMPLFDALGNTLNKNSWALHKKLSSTAGTKGIVPDFVFLAHVVDVTSSMHAPFFFRSFSSLPFTTRLFLLPLWPGAFLLMLAMWAWAKTFVNSFYNIRNRLNHTWVVPRFGFQYFLPFSVEGINKHIEEAILAADELGVKVISLAALNKNEALNGGGTLFVEKYPDLRVRVVHGNTLTAAAILNGIPPEVTEVFVTGATSKLGRAIALYLCRRRVRVLERAIPAQAMTGSGLLLIQCASFLIVVLFFNVIFMQMLTRSTERFQNIQKEAPSEFQNYLVQVTKYQAARTCKTWIVGKWITPQEQNWAPAGTHFHQFVVPPILNFRKDCTYGDLAAMRLPDDVEGLGSCEYTMGRGVVHACHAGGVVHLLEGWTHHEVGAIDVDRIDLVWNSAMKHGFSHVSSSNKASSS